MCVGKCNSKSRQASITKSEAINYDEADELGRPRRRIIVIASLRVTHAIDGLYFFFFQAEDGIRDLTVTGVQTCALPILLGANALMSAPFEGTNNLLAGTGVEDVPEIRTIAAAPGVDVTLLVRPAQDRLQQVIASTWSWVGDYGVPSDAGTGDAALYKRGVVIEHA